jgi:hypothetical protein
MHGSASTWVFNIVRELMIGAKGEGNVCALYAEKPDGLPDQAARAEKSLLIKSHQGSAEMDAWLAASAAMIVLSLRDPRDASLSMAQRFNTRLEHAVHWIAQDCNRLAKLAGRGYTMLRYEDRFFDHPSTVASMARLVGAPPDEGLIAAIFERYRTESVRAFAGQLDKLPPDRVITGAASRLDRVTQIHGTHIGDARSGKWRDLPAPVQAELTRVFSPFLERFGYPR